MATKRGLKAAAKAAAEKKAAAEETAATLSPAEKKAAAAEKRKAAAAAAKANKAAAPAATATGKGKEVFCLQHKETGQYLGKRGNEYEFSRDAKQALQFDKEAAAETLRTQGSLGEYWETVKQKV